VAYLVLWHYAPNFDATATDLLPNWAVVLAGWCILAYYTLDCMDGKQARRTNSSSPLGQLFDHGFDCICTYFFIIIMGTVVMLGNDTRWMIAFQSCTQFAFYMAQWEEYHTHTLQSCTGKWVGVSEVNYSMGVFIILNGFIGGNYRVLFYSTPMKDVLGPIVSDFLPIALSSLEVRYFILLGWFVMSAILMILSILRVMNHPNIVGSERDVGSRRIMALSKLVSPMILLASSLLLPPTSVRTRYLSIALGIVFSLLTKKMIVFSMAKMAYAAIQYDVLPLLFISLWIRYDPRLTRKGADFVMGLLCLWYLHRLLRWVNVTINQICKRLNVYCFRLKPRKKMRVE
jgi:ethanolaminephosphotransferase